MGHFGNLNKEGKENHNVSPAQSIWSAPLNETAYNGGGMARKNLSIYIIDANQA